MTVDPLVVDPLVVQAKRDSSVLPMTAYDAVGGSSHRHCHMPKCGVAKMTLTARFWLFGGHQQARRPSAFRYRSDRAPNPQISQTHPSTKKIAHSWLDGEKPPKPPTPLKNTRSNYTSTTAIGSHSRRTNVPLLTAESGPKGAFTQTKSGPQGPLKTLP